MKKLLLILASVIIAVATVSLTTSCKKDIEKAKSLIGTQWVSAGISGTYTLKFLTQYEFEMKVVGDGTRSYQGTFIITGDYFTLTYNDSSWGTDWKDGKFIDDNRLTLNNYEFTRVI